MIYKLIPIYFLSGVAWSAWLEYFCTTSLEEPYNSPFSIKERIFHISLWPITLTAFVYRFLVEYLKN